MKDKTIDIITKNNKVIGQENKYVAHQKGLRHRVSAVLLQREDGKYLIPTASEIKTEAGRLFHCQKEAACFAGGLLLCSRTCSCRWVL